ncbi:carcinine transporter [Drosophila sulfurigaster albostrigata]|uniref:carcinine transporter n=1 Tax=Drosophila sulfurigaster albostrigata TaxID=89887 RepID=UPI00147194EE|nr:carcinine transporter [Drosophila sulfurigaster albostrigata]
MTGEIVDSEDEYDEISELRQQRNKPEAQESVDEAFDLDDLLPIIGEFGKYQKLLVFGICLPACIPCGFCAFNQLFMADTPDDYWCRVPQLQHLDLEQRKMLAIPKEQDNDDLVYSKCFMYGVNWTQLLDTLDTGDINGNLTNLQLNNGSWPLVKCSQGWEYNTSRIWSSIVIDFDLVCDQDIYPTIGLAALNTGGPVGVYLFGLLNDRAGRRLSYFTCLATLLAGSLMTSLSKDFWTWAGSRVIVGLTIPAVYQIPFIISLELVGEKYRSFVTVMTCTFYTSGIMLLSLVTYLERDWVRLSYITSLPFYAYFLYMFVMPESPRWLLMRGRLEEALKILERMALINGRQFPEAVHSKLEAQIRRDKLKSQKKKVANVGLMDLCRTPNMRLKTILITLSWFANETVYLGLSYYGPSLGTNQYVSFFLSAVVELPSYLCCWYFMDTWGRRWPLSLSMMLGGVACIITVMLPDDAIDETLTLYLISKALLSASFLIIYPFAGELYPTQVRGIGIGASSYIGGLGLIVIPFVTYLGKENLKLPLVIMGFVSVLGGMTGLRLPETLHHRLPQTIEEGEEFGKNWQLKDCCRCKPQPEILSPPTSYENLDVLGGSSNNESEVELELKDNRRLRQKPRIDERTPLDLGSSGSGIGSRPVHRPSMKRLVRQMSVMDTQRTHDGTMQLTHWI